uniref:Uncharacterized protein n=1 Tax=Ciona intestinalis TaxID=7719 RepID=H2XSG6_CIOIN
MFCKFLIVLLCLRLATAAQFQELKNASVAVGAPALFYTVITGDSRNSITWQENGVDIAELKIINSSWISKLVSTKPSSVYETTVSEEGTTLV